MLQRLDVQRTDPIGSGIAIRRGVKSLASRTSRDRSQGGREDLALRREDEVGAPDDSGRAFAGLDGHTRQVQRIHGARARGVERQTRAVQIEDVVDTVTQQRDAAAGDAVRLRILRVAVLHELMIIVEVAYEDARLGAGQRLERGACRLQRFIDYLEQLALRRVQARCFLRLDAEEGGIELARVFVQETAAARVKGSGPARLWVIPGFQVHAFGREIAV